MEELIAPPAEEAVSSGPAETDPSPEGEHAFVIEVRSRSSGTLDGFVLHLSSGHRERVQHWEDVIRVINAALWTEVDPLDADGT
jgi:hypothetical protein